MSQIPDLTAITSGELADGDSMVVRDVSVSTPTGKDKKLALSELTTKLASTFASRASNLSDLASAPTARTNLGLGTMATQSASAFMPIYQTANTVYIDSTNGNDSTGSKGHPELPFATLAKAAAVASAGDTIIWRPGNYTLSSTDISTYGQPNIKSGQTWLCQGPVLTQTTAATTIFTSGSSGNVRSDFSFLGNLRIKGNGYSNPGGWASIGFDLNYCERFCIEGVTIGTDVNEANGNTNGYTGRAFYVRNSLWGRFSRLATNHCLTGLEIPVGSEYHVFSDCLWRNSSDSVILGGGNNRFSNCNIHTGYTGLLLNNGSNHGHGSWIGGSINHCTTNAVNANAVTNGFTFDNVHFYADSATTNIIRLSACQRVHFHGGTLSSPVTLAGTLPGINLLHGVDILPGNVVLSDPGSQIGQLVIADCYSPSGAWTSF